MNGAAGVFGKVPEPRMREFIASQRWFGAKNREIAEFVVLDEIDLASGPGSLVSSLIEIRFSGGTHDVYQLLARPGSSDNLEAVLDVFGEPAAVARLIELTAGDAVVTSDAGAVEFSSLRGLPDPTGIFVRPLGVEQSNSSVVVDDQLIVKLYRRLEPGVNPELELLRFLSRTGFPNVPELRGWWGYSGAPMTATLGIAQRFLPDARDGWELGRSLLTTAPSSFLDTLQGLGSVVGAMHSALASDRDDPAFAPETASPEALGLLTATIDDEIELVFDHLPDDKAVAPISGRGEVVRQVLHGLATAGSVGQLIRLHGDLHLGQVLRAENTWFVIDFEGEPARSLPERRAKHSPLRDVAGMLRSLSYLAAVTGHSGDQLEAQARELFLDGYLDAVQSAGILPPSPQLERLISIFELEKVVYELRYELDHRPDWVHIPVSALERMLEHEGA